MTDLLDLAARVEAAEGPDRELDEAIADALFTEKQRTCIAGLSDEEGGMWMWRNPDGSIGTALRFTASLDAAMTLVPEGCAPMLDWLRYKNNPTIYYEGYVQRVENAAGLGQAEARTPALALCAAALRARAADEGLSHD